jgi:integrase
MRARVILTEKQIEYATPARVGQRYMLWDAVTPSLALRVTDRGHKSFVVQRRVNGRMVKLTLGQYPALKLAAAREAARDKLKVMERGIDPRQGAPSPVTGSTLRRDSFEGAVETYIRREVERNRRPRTQDEIIRPLRNRLVPRWGTLPLGDIGPRDILDDLVDAGTPVAANRTYSVLRRFFGWCVERHLITVNPAISVRKPYKEQSRSRVLLDDELREVWIATDTLDWPFSPLIRGLILTGQRRNELAGMVWAELDFAENQWTIPGHRTKNGQEHVVPLSPAMRGILDAAPCFTNKEGEFDKALPVFTTTGETPVSGFSRAKAKLDATVLAARRSATAAQGRNPDKAKPLAHWTLHDLRRSCATGMARIGVQPHIIEAVLNHSSGFRAGVAGVYQRHPYFEERKRALDAWAEHITRLGTPREPASNVVSLKRTAP